MLKTLQDSLNKSCLVGLTYFDVDGNELKRQLLGGTVIEMSEEMGITISLFTTKRTKLKKRLILSFLRIYPVGLSRLRASSILLVKASE